jgi:hypothetical protein
MSKTKVIFPKVTVEGLGGLGNSVDSVTITEQINQIPTATISLHEAEDISVKPPMDQKTMDAYGLLQQTRVSGQQGNKITVTINLEGDDAQTAVFQGYPLGPEIQCSTSYYANSIRLLHPCATLNTFQPYIYAVVPGVPNADLDDPYQEQVQADNADIPSTGNFMERLKAVVKARMDNFDSERTNQWIDGSTLSQIATVHTRNKNHFALLEALCDDSTEDTYESLSGALGEQAIATAFNRRINAYIGEFVSGSKDDFFSNIMTFANGSQMFYVPPSVSNRNDDGSTAGFMRPFKQMASDEAESEQATLSPSYVGMSCSEMKLDVTTGVVISGAPVTPEVSDLDNKAEATILPLINYPTYFAVTNGVDAGNMVNIPLPQWIPFSSLIHVITGEEDTSENVVDISQYKAKKSEIVSKVTRTYTDNFHKILEEYSENVLADAQYSPYSMVAKTLLDFSWKAGYQYEIKIEREDTEATTFKGFLDRVVHTVKVDKQAGECSTMLSFTHVRLT